MAHNVALLLGCSLLVKVKQKYIEKPLFTQQTSRLQCADENEWLFTQRFHMSMISTHGLNADGLCTRPYGATNFAGFSSSEPFELPDEWVPTAHIGAANFSRLDDSNPYVTLRFVPRVYDDVSVRLFPWKTDSNFRYCEFTISGDATRIAFTTDRQFRVHVRQTNGNIGKQLCVVEDGDCFSCLRFVNEQTIAFTDFRRRNVTELVYGEDGSATTRHLCTHKFIISIDYRAGALLVVTAAACHVYDYWTGVKRVEVAAPFQTFAPFTGACLSMDGKWVFVSTRHHIDKHAARPGRFRAHHQDAVLRTGFSFDCAPQLEMFGNDSLAVLGSGFVQLINAATGTKTRRHTCPAARALSRYPEPDTLLLEMNDGSIAYLFDWMHSASATWIFACILPVMSYVPI